MKLLVTGFDPWNESPLNPSGEVVKQLAPPPPGWELRTQILPVAYELTRPAVQGLLEEYEPDIFVATGEFRGITTVRLERIAINLVNYTIADNLEKTVTDQTIEAEGPAAYWSPFPLRLLEETLKAAGVPTALSLSAGSHVCNLTMYTGLHWAATRRPASWVGFVHLPALTAQMVDAARQESSWPLEFQSLALACVVQTLSRAYEEQR